LYGWRGWDSEIWLRRFADLLRVLAEAKHKPLYSADVRQKPNIATESVSLLLFDRRFPSSE
jgi:hypothetical protein